MMVITITTIQYKMCCVLLNEWLGFKFSKERWGGPNFCWCPAQDPFADDIQRMLAGCTMGFRHLQWAVDSSTFLSAFCNWLMNVVRGRIMGRIISSGKDYGHWVRRIDDGRISTIPTSRENAIRSSEGIETLTSKFKPPNTMPLFPLS